MGRLRNTGIRLLRTTRAATWEHKDRLGLILGTGWSDPAVLAEEGFEIERQITFADVNVDAGKGAEHPNRFLLGTWHGKDVVISQGRIHVYQNSPECLRSWTSVLLALMGNGSKIIITSAVGGLTAGAKIGTVVQPTGLISAHLPMPYLNGAAAEFVMSEHLLWVDHAESGTHRPQVQQTFMEAARAAKFQTLTDATHIVVTGPGFGGSRERKLWASWGCDTVGMSPEADLRMIAVENQDNPAVATKESPGQMEVFAAFMVTDDHDLPSHPKIKAELLARAPQLGTFLSSVVQSDW